VKDNMIRLLGSAKRRLALVEDIDTNSSKDYQGGDAPVLPIKYDVTAAEANLVTSYAVAYTDHLHYPVLDLDFGVQVVPSSTPGQYHLYLDRIVSWEKYSRVLDAMADAGLLERGYVDASKKRGHTAVRLPWVRKGQWKKAS